MDAVADSIVGAALSNLSNELCDASRSLLNVGIEAIEIRRGLAYAQPDKVRGRPGPAVQLSDIGAAEDAAAASAEAGADDLERV